ncbi:hypothetical protein [Methanobacterium ferruginis]|uniref:hypothetical protein n=1 Tax=Methanobacterium ferruginis TaxID=710191 RepID=UPI0025747D04|nr:hypothetical protein [Methanobacterium ferruginis]BDZ68595.1 hypothetical protein GCM10025860_20430 [Methanobacterium ferruginis]
MTYAVSEEVTNLTNEIMEPMTTDVANATLTKAISHAEIKINSKLRKNNIDISTIPDTVEEKDPINNLIEAGTLYAAAFVFDTGYSGNETSSPAVRTYRSDADELVDAYIEIIREGYNTEDPDIKKSVKIPVGSLVRRCY